MRYDKEDDKVGTLMTTATAANKLALAEQQLARVQAACDPPDWADLSNYGFHALENAVDAACLHLGMEVHTNHPARQVAAEHLHREHGFDEVSDLLGDLNETRKSENYGDIEAPELDAEDMAMCIESYVEAVRKLLGGQ